MASTSGTRRTVRDCMHRDFIRISPDEDLLAATRLMSMARVRDLPVVVDGRLEGMISHRDLARAALERALDGGREALREPITRWVRPVEETVDPDTPLEEAGHRMRRSGRPCVPVVGSGGGSPQVLGLLTESDLLGAAFGAS